MSKLAVVTEMIDICFCFPVAKSHGGESVIHLLGNIKSHMPVSAIGQYHLIAIKRNEVKGLAVCLPKCPCAVGKNTCVVSIKQSFVGAFHYVKNGVGGRVVICGKRNDMIFFDIKRLKCFDLVQLQPCTVDIFSVKRLRSFISRLGNIYMERLIAYFICNSLISALQVVGIKMVGMIMRYYAMVYFTKVKSVI